MNVKGIHALVETVWTPKDPTSASVVLDIRARRPEQSAEVMDIQPYLLLSTYQERK